METQNNESKTCRICFENGKNSILIFSDEAKKLHLLSKIQKYLYITISTEDTFPKIVCNKCVKTLNWIHKFATMAVKTQDKFSKLLPNIVSSSKNNSGKETENHYSLLHSYLTQDKTEKLTREDTNNDNEITEMEVRIDPMLILQYKEEYDANSASDEEENNSMSSQDSDFHRDIDIKKPYECQDCPKRFSSQFALQSHIWCHSRERKILAINNLNKSQDEKDCLNEQIDDEKIVSELSCPICAKTLVTTEQLKIHLDSHQPKGKYGCDICGRIFKTEMNLCRHKEYHEGLQHPCSVCGRVYPTNSTLRAHSITHSDIRPHKCNVCDKTFKRNQDLKFHINQHTGARPYQCPYCPKAFASSGNCFSHRKRMHPQQVERDREKALLT